MNERVRAYALVMYTGYVYVCTFDCMRDGPRTQSRTLVRSNNLIQCKFNFKLLGGVATMSLGWCAHVGVSLFNRVYYCDRAPVHPDNYTTRGGTRTHHLLLRREAPYPLGHTGFECVQVALHCIC